MWGRKRLCFVSTNGTVNLYDDTELGGIADETTDDNGAVSTVAITDEITTRGYNLQTPERKKWHAARVNVQTLDASFTAKAQVDGVEEKTTITTITPDRAKYDKPFYQADYTVSNVNDDFNVPYRQDYSVSMSNSDSIWLSKQVNGNWTDAANAVSTVKINPNHRQETTHKLRLKDEGRYSQIQIESSGGSTNITSVLVDGLLKENIMRKES